MKITIGRRSWTAIHIWIDKGRFNWLSAGKRRHSRKITARTQIIVS